MEKTNTILAPDGTAIRVNEIVAVGPVRVVDYHLVFEVATKHTTIFIRRALTDKAVAYEQKVLQHTAFKRDREAFVDAWEKLL